MDRLLRFLLKTFIRRGTFRVTTSRGTVLTFGDGTGQPVSVRFATRAAEWAILLDPELKFGEAYMNGTFVVEQGSIADVLAIMLGQKSEVPHWARPQGAAALPPPPLAAVQPAPRARAATSRITTISTAGSIRSSSTPTGNIAAPISRSPSSRSTTPSSPRSGISPPSCCSKPRQARARHRLRLGRARPLSRRSRRRRRHRRHAVGGAARRRQRARRGKGPGRPRPLPPAGLSRRQRAIRPHRLGRHVRACRRRPLRHASSASARNCSPTTA